MNKKTYESNPKMWVDQDGKEVQTRFITPFDRDKQKRAVRIFKAAQKVAQELDKLKSMMAEDIEAIQDVHCKDRQVGATPTFSFTTYDRRLKIERTRNERVLFDDNLLAAAHSKFKNWLSGFTEDKSQILVELVMDAFTQVKGKPDTKKLLSLLQYRSKISDPTFADALNTLEESIGKGNSKYYYRISERSSNGEYKYLNLDFASL
jgi:hypothetical protein